MQLLGRALRARRRLGMSPPSIVDRSQPSVLPRRRVRRVSTPRPLSPELPRLVSRRYHGGTHHTESQAQTNMVSISQTVQTNSHIQGNIKRTRRTKHTHGILVLVPVHAAVDVAQLPRQRHLRLRQGPRGRRRLRTWHLRARARPRLPSSPTPTASSRTPTTPLTAWSAATDGSASEPRLGVVYRPPPSNILVLV